MTASLLFAAAAGVVAAGATVDLAAVAGQRARLRSARRRVAGQDGSLEASRVDRATGRSLLALVKRIGARFGLPAPGGLSTRLVAADVTLPLADAMALKVGAATISTLALPPLASLVSLRMAVVLGAVLPAFSFCALDLWLLRRGRARARQAAHELPDVLDLVRIALTVGMTATTALALVGERHQGLLAREFRRIVGLISLGEPRAQVLTDLKRRCRAPGVAVFVATLLRAERYGTPITAALAAQAEQARSERARLAVESAARAVPQIQLIVALLLVPSVFLLLAAAVLTSL